MAERYVVVGLARSRCRWFGELARWANAAVAPIDFVKCLTAEEARAVIGTGRPVSALLLDGALPRLDRDLVRTADRAGAPTILVGGSARDWESLGCATLLDEDFTRDQLVETLDRWARRIARSEERSAARVEFAEAPARGDVVAVLGASGAGASTVAMAAAQGLAARGEDVVLVDGCRRADLAMYHRVDVLPGLPELVELHRGDDADPDEVRTVETDIPDRGYRLVAGMRRARDWAGMRPASISAAVDGLRRAHGVVVLDLDADLERESDTGSVDVEERHALTLLGIEAAGAVLVVARAALKGVHDAARLVDDLRRVGIDDRVVRIVLTGAPRSPASRAQLARAVRDLTDGAAGRGPSLLPHLRAVEGCHRSAAPLPAALCAPLADLLTPVERRRAGGGPSISGPQPIAPGELGASLRIVAPTAGRAGGSPRPDERGEATG